MAQLLTTLVGVVAAIALTVGVFAALNAFVDLAPRRFTAFATITGAVAGLVAGIVANSGGWFLGGPLWPVGGALLGAALGGLVWARRPPSPARRRRIPQRLRPAIFLTPALIFLAASLVIPTIRTAYLSLRNRRGTDFVGIDNFRTVFGDSSIFTLEGAGDIVSSRLFLAGCAVALGAVVLAAVRARARHRDFDVTGPVPVVGGGLAFLLLMLALVGSLRAVLWNNLFWIVFVTGFSVVLGLAIAVLADRARAEPVAKSLIFMPMAISFVGASVIWRFVYAFTPAAHDQIGLLNAGWVALGGEPQAWIQQRPWNTLFLIAIMIWIQTGFAMVLFSAAIKGVPDELLEAARVDGASPAQAFWRITLPQIRSTLGVVVITLVISVLKVYDIVKVMTNGEFGTNVIANQMYDEAFRNRDFGRGSTLAVLLFIGVLPLMVFNVRRARREVR
jgi:ABC-type sugar transport system permease subunit